MATGGAARWNISVSKDTDEALRTYLAQRGMKRGDISKFVEDAVKWRVFDSTIVEAREALADIPPGDLQSLVDEAVRSGRAAATK